MKKLALGAIVLLTSALAACGGGGSDDDDVIFIDASTIDGNDPPACNAAENSGCAAGQKCTWINIDSDNDLGTIGCVAEGTVASGGACMYGPDGETTGFDDCVGGQICISGACEAICTISPDSCDTNTSCSRYAGLFTGSTPELGACDFLCDPVTQVRLSDSAAVCGGTGTGTAATKGCNGFFDGDFTCAGVPATVAANPNNYVQEDVPYGPASGGAYLNGCAPGFAPTWVLENTSTAALVCMAYCDPVPTSLESGLGANGQSPNACSDRGAFTQACYYFWVWETYDAATAPLHPDNVGFCWTPENFVGDWDGDANTPDSGFPRCNATSSADPNYNFYGCAPYVQAAQGSHGRSFKAPLRWAHPGLEYQK
jgi:hypothetical protein